MDRWQDSISKPSQCRYPSFSSTLLDAIYRSIDDEHRESGAPDPFPAQKKQADPSRWIPPVTPPKISGSSRDPWSRRSPGSLSKPPVTRSTTSSSSDSSSYGGFSSSETESVSTRLRPIRTSPTRNQPATHQPKPPQPAIACLDEKKPKKDRRGSIRTRLLRELRKGGSPASPGARLANFLNSLFATKSKVSRNSFAGVGESASSCSRSCLSKKPLSQGQSRSAKRTVRFCPISVIVGEDCRPCGHKCVYAGDGAQTAAPSRSVAEMLRSVMEAEEEEDWESDSSSDLFELDNLAVIGQFRDELPVYETTRFANYSSVSHGLAL